MQSIYSQALPFTHLDDEEFNLIIYELTNGRINFDQDRLQSLSFNPLLFQSKNKFRFNSDLDPDQNFFDQLYGKQECKYYVEEEFNNMVRKQCKLLTPSFSALHLNIRSIQKNIS